MRSEVCRRSASPRCRKPRAAAALLLVSLGGLFACSTPAEFETAPEFLGLQPAFYSVSAPTSGTRLPDDSCPRALPTIQAGTRRTLTEIGATINLPSDTREIAHAFGSRPGAAFLSQSLGLIAFGYDSDLPTLLSRTERGLRGSQWGPVFFTRWCPITIGGVRATLFIDPYIVRRDSTRSIAFLPDIVITTTSPSGRRVNMRISGTVLPLDSLAPMPPALLLVAAAVGIQW